MKCLVTGTSGFIGRALVARLVADGQFDVYGATRQNLINPVIGAKYIQIGDLTSKNSWPLELRGVHTVVHAAARVHVLNDRASDPLTEFRKVNVAGTLQLAEQAVAMGVRRFVFMSSVGVNGVQTAPGKPFSEIDKPNPHNAYAVSKWEAEQGLMRIADETGLSVVIIRPPLVYGYCAPGNFGVLLRAVQGGWPLPLGAVHNQRSLVALDNLLDFIVTCMSHAQAVNQTFLLSDGDDQSSIELVRGLACAARVQSRLFPIPVWALQAGATLLGKSDAIQGLCGNLQVDISKARILLGWTPPVSVDEGLHRAIRGGGHETNI